MASLTYYPSGLPKQQPNWSDVQTRRAEQRANTEQHAYFKTLLRPTKPYGHRSYPLFLRGIASCTQAQQYINVKTLAL